MELTYPARVSHKYTHSKERSQQQTHGHRNKISDCSDLLYLKSHLNGFPSERTICAYVCICVSPPPMDNSTKTNVVTIGGKLKVFYLKEYCPGKKVPLHTLDFQRNTYLICNNLVPRLSLLCEIIPCMVF